MAETKKTLRITQVKSTIARPGDQLQTLKAGSMTKISSDAKQLQGDMATALQEELEKLGNELLNLKKGVDQVATTLFDFAKRLDIADEQAKAMIQSR